MQVLLDVPRLMVQYGSAAVTTDELIDYDALAAPWVDGSNGLCGAGVPGVLELQIGTHTGWVPFRVELHDSAPALESTWDEVVEVSFTTSRDEACLAGLLSDGFIFRLPRGDYRVRYCVTGFDAAKHSDDAVDMYLLQLWPGKPAPGCILVQTDVEASFWHNARRTPPASNGTSPQAPTSARRLSPSPMQTDW